MLFRGIFNITHPVLGLVLSKDVAESGLVTIKTIKALLRSSRPNGKSQVLDIGLIKRTEFPFTPGSLNVLFL